jgi:hypothetical protein
MDTTGRVQRWRQRKRDAGKEAMTIWLSRDTKLRLEDLAAAWRLTPSELIEQALAQFHPGSPPGFGNVTDSPQLQALLAEAARALLPALKSELLHDLLPALASTAPVTATNSNATVTEPQETTYEADPGHSLVTEPAPARAADSQPRAYGEVPAAVLAVLAQQQPATAAEVAKALGDHSKAGVKRIWQALQRLCKSGKVVVTGKEYRLG